VEPKDLPEAGGKDLALMTKIVDETTTDPDVCIYHDGNKERIQVLNYVRNDMRGCPGE
jgi:hypothetical protein